MSETKPKPEERLDATPLGWPWSDATRAIFESWNQPTWVIPQLPRDATITWIPSAWECPRCHVINAPHVDRCNCQESAP